MLSAEFEDIWLVYKLVAGIPYVQNKTPGVSKQFSCETGSNVHWRQVILNHLWFYLHLSIIAVNE